MYRLLREFSDTEVEIRSRGGESIWDILLTYSLKCVSIGSGNISRSFCNGYIFVYQKGVHSIRIIMRDRGSLFVHMVGFYYAFRSLVRG